MDRRVFGRKKFGDGALNSKSSRINEFAPLALRAFPPIGVKGPNAPTPRLRAHKVKRVICRRDLNDVRPGLILTRPLAAVLEICFNSVSGGSWRGFPNQHSPAGIMIEA